MMAEALPLLDASNHGAVRDLAALPEWIRGYEEVKERNIEWAKQEAARLFDKLRTPQESPEA